MVDEGDCRMNDAAAGGRYPSGARQLKEFRGLQQAECEYNVRIRREVRHSYSQRHREALRMGKRVAQRFSAMSN